ncbi:MAG TPA: Ig-like domain-containing protein, partial [bacterium]|nr:Ig-like domain-containing protein [bacterium]
MRMRKAIAAASFIVAAIACSATQTSPYFAVTSPVILIDSAPAAGATAVPLDAVMEAEFGGSVSTAGLGTYFHLFAGSTAGTPVAAHFATGLDDRLVRLIPNAALTPNADYTAKIDEGFPDAKGRPIAGTSWSFHTANPPAPLVNELVPAAARVSVPTNFVLRAAFNVPLDPDTVSTITVLVTDSSSGLSFQPVNVSYDADAHALLFAPTVDAVPNATVTVAVSSSSLRDAFGRSISGAAFGNWTFSTGPNGDYLKPVVTSTTTVAEAPAGSGTAVLALPTATDTDWSARELRWEATFSHAALPVPAGCPDVPDPQITRVAIVGTGSLSVSGLSNGIWNVSLTAEDGSGRRSDATVAKTFTITAGAVTFDTQIKPVLDQRCAFDGCHAGANSPGFMDLTLSRDQIEGYHPVNPAKPIAVQP